MSCLLPLVVPAVPGPKSTVPSPVPLKINPKGVYLMEWTPKVELYILKWRPKWAKKSS